MDLDAEQQRTLQLSPLWVLSALAGTSRFADDELSAFWDAVVQVSLRTPPDARAILVSLTADRSGLLLDFELDERSAVTGFTHTNQALAAVDPPTAADYRLALLRIGMAMGRARGPYGRSLTFEDTQMLLLVAQLLDLETVPPLDATVCV